MNAQKMRKYWHPNGIYVPSVTSCDIDSKAWLAPWAAKATLSCAMELHKTKPIETWDEDDIKWIKKETKRQAERGMHIGTIFHEMALDGYLATGEWPGPKDCPSWDEVCDAAHEFKGYGQMRIAFQEWCELYLKEVHDTEFICYGDRYAGRCDLLATVSNYAWLTKKAQKTTEEKDVLCYCDLKTSTQFAEFTPMQIAGYREGDGRSDEYGKSADGLIIRVDKDNALHNLGDGKPKRVIYTKHIDDEGLSDAYRRLMYRVDFIWKESNWQETWKNVEKTEETLDGDD